MSVGAPSPVEAPSALGEAGLATDVWPRVGERWRSIYEIREQLSETTAGRYWRAARIDTDENVVLRIFHTTVDEARPGAWDGILALDSAHLLRARPAFMVENCRVEEFEAPVGTALSRWRRQSGGIDADGIEALVRQVASVLSQLHGVGLVHLGLHPDSIYVREEDGKLHFVVGALESVTPFERDRLIPAPVDPFYAPPEAAGLFQHSPGPILRAWDWWTLGRAVQEAILGCHVLGHILEREVIPATPELNARMEAMLLERDAAGLRAGAVEAMPVQDKRVDNLLRGLLTSTRDGRWGREEIDGWLKRDTIKHRYGLPRTERLFRLGERPLTVPEAADLLRTPDLWPEIVPHVFNLKQPGMLAHFLDDSHAHRSFLEKLTDALKLAESDALKSYPSALVREVVAALALQYLAGNEFIWRGRRTDTATIREILDAPGDPKAQLELARLFSQRVVVGQIQRCDAESAQILGDLGRVGGEAEALAISSGWLTMTDTTGILRLWSTVLLSQAAMQGARANLKKRFACCSNAAMNKIFQLEAPARLDLVVLAWADREPAKFGFVTHAEWAKRRLGELRATGDKYAMALFWRRLGKALSIGTWLFSRWRILVPIWVGVITLGLVAHPGPRWAFVAILPALLAAAWRVFSQKMHASQTKLFAPAAAPWGWRDGVKRCRTEAEAVAPGLDEAGLLRMIREINADIAKLQIEPKPEVIVMPPKFHSTWVAVIGSWIAVGLVVATHGWEIKIHPPSIAAFRAAWAAKPPPIDEEAAKPIKVTWPHKAVGEIHVVNLKGHEEATPEQRAAAMAAGHKIADPYLPETITLFIAVRVPTEKEYGFMMYNGKTGQLANQHVYLTIYEPLPRMWIELSGEQAIYMIP